MNIQPSLILWTILSFCVFMLAADRLLFRPLLAVMDARREKLDAARARREAARNARDEAARQAALDREESRRLRQEEALAALERFRAEAEAERAAAVRSNAAETADARRALTDPVPSGTRARREAAVADMADAFEDQMLTYFLQGD